MVVFCGCPLWLSFMVVLCGCPLWLSFVVVFCGCPLWLSFVVVLYGCPLWLSFVVVLYGCHPLLFSEAPVSYCVVLWERSMDYTVTDCPLRLSSRIVIPGCPLLLSWSSFAAIAVSTWNVLRCGALALSTYVVLHLVQSFWRCHSLGLSFWVVICGCPMYYITAIVSLGHLKKHKTFLTTASFISNPI